MVARFGRTSWYSVLALTICICVAGAAEPATRTATVARANDPADDAARGRLERVLPEVKFDGVAFEDVIAFLSDITGQSIFVNMRVLEAAGVKKDAAVSFHLKEVKFSTVISTVLDAAGGKTKLGYTIDGGAIVISTQADLRKRTLTKVYDVRDLVEQVVDYVGPGKSETRPATLPTRAKLLGEIIQLISDTIDPDSWREKGGDVGAIRGLSGQLIVTQTAENHRQIEQLIAQLRECRSVQIVIESRFIAVDEAILKELKLDGPADGKKPGSAFLGDAEVNALLKQVQERPETTVLTAPRVTAFNGQYACVSITSQQAYVADYTTIKSDKGEVRFETVMKTLETGLVYEMCGAASADRRSVTLSLKPKLTSLVKMERRKFEQSPADREMMIDMPKCEVTELNTAVRVPDGQTVALTGMKLPSGEVGGLLKADRKASVVLLLVKPRIVVEK